MLHILKTRNCFGMSRQLVKCYAAAAKSCDSGKFGANEKAAKTKSTLPPSLLQLQKQFQKKSDLPVFLRGGQKDVILYYATLGFTGVGLIMDAVFYAGIIM